MAYQSEFTLFMNEWLEQHPEQKAEQEKGRALWWDKPQTAESGSLQNDSKVPTKPYYYDSNH